MLNLLLVLSAGPASAADLDTWRPSGSGLAGEGGFQVVTPTVGAYGAAYGGVLVGYAADVVVPPGEGDVLSPALRHLVGARLVGGYAFGHAFRLDMDLPTYPWVGFSDPDQSGFALGDLRARGVIGLVRGGSVGEGIALIPSVSVPTGAEARLVGANGVGVGLGASMGARLAGPLLFSANLGLDTGPTTDLGLRAVGGALHGAAGLEWAATPGLGLGLEVDGEVDLLSALVADPPNPVEAHAYALFGPPTGLVGTLGAGTGLARGVGTPDLRLVAGLAWRVEGSRPVRDTDRDGILNVHDTCPDDAEDRDGHADTDGCPDLDDDGDQIPDAVDACRDRPEDLDGFEDRDGCPESDNDRDGVADTTDRCPTQAGLPGTDGCPDTDGDGISDAADTCPTAAGPGPTGGCPDGDGDGLVDAVDLCPEDPADPPSDGSVPTGCPALARLGADRISLREPVRFEAGTPKLERVPNAVLDALARVLNAHPELRRVEIAGHTDNEGDRKANLALSQAQAEAVVKYLITSGRVDPSRLVAVGYGDRTPVDSNETAAGRARNRRIEVRLLP